MDHESITEQSCSHCELERTKTRKRQETSNYFKVIIYRHFKKRHHLPVDSMCSCIAELQ